MAEDDDLRQFLGTTSFGAKQQTKNLEAAYSRTERAPPVSEKPHSDKPVRRTTDSDEDSIEDSSDEENEYPITHEIILTKHTRLVSGLAIDPAGGRIVSGSHDSLVSLWDFAGMGHAHRPFKVIEAFETHQIHSTEFNCTGEVVLISAANWQPKLVSRDGEEMGEMSRGDPYLREMKNTRGHVGEVTAGKWHPKNENQCATASADSTVRIWDANNVSKCLQVMTYKPKTAGSGRVKCTSAEYATDGNAIGASYADGSLGLWSTDGPYHRPTGGMVSDAHAPDDAITDLAFSLNGWSFVSRGIRSVKIWDRRNFKQPLAVRGDLPCSQDGGSVVYSPNYQEVLIASSSHRNAQLHILSARDLRSVQTASFASPVSKILYHDKINQILTGHANGDVSVLYSPEHSLRGAKLVVSRAPKARHVDDMLTADIDESAGEVLQDDASLLQHSSSRMQNAARKDPKLSNMPQIPSTQRFAERKVVGDIVNFRDQDPQKELLKYDEAAKNDPVFFGVYKKNQPVSQFAPVEDTEESDTTPTAKRAKTHF